MKIIFIFAIYIMAVLQMHNIINTNVIGGYWLTLIASIAGLVIGLLSIISIHRLQLRKLNLSKFPQPFETNKSTINGNFPFYFFITSFIGFILFSSINNLGSLSQPNIEQFSVIDVSEKRVSNSSEKYAKISNGVFSISYLLNDSNHGLSKGDIVEVKIQRGLLGFRKAIELKKSNNSFERDVFGCAKTAPQFQR